MKRSPLAAFFSIFEEGFAYPPRKKLIDSTSEVSIFFRAAEVDHLAYHRGVEETVWRCEIQCILAPSFARIV